jgi:hypothetical protein
MVKRYTKKHFEEDIHKLESFLGGMKKEEKKGGHRHSSLQNQEVLQKDRDISTKSRHFKLIEADKKEMNLGYVKVHPETGTPVSAAKKLFRSYSHSLNLAGADKLKVKATFTIQETTKDSSKKIYGPYIGSWKALSEKDKKDATRSGVHFAMRSVVRLKGESKKNNSKKVNQKGGKKKEEDEEEDDMMSSYGSEDDEYEEMMKEGKMGG